MNCLKAAFQIGTSQQQRKCHPADALKMQQRRPNQFIVLMHRIQQTRSRDAATKKLYYNYMVQLFRESSSLLFSQQLQAKPAINLALERLYYADGRHNPDHPRHGSFDGLNVLPQS